MIILEIYNTSVCAHGLPSAQRFAMLLIQCDANSVMAVNTSVSFKNAVKLALKQCQIPRISFHFNAR
jgi:hypothetical protein